MSSSAPPVPGRLGRFSRIAVELLGELVAPARCAACEEHVRARVLFCAACGVSVLPAGAQPEGQHALFDYGGAVATAIVRLKYASRSDLATRFADVLGDHALTLAGSVDVVVPVPLHPRRLAERGFDQAALLSGPVARRLGLPHAPRALLRIRETPRQASLDRDARAANVEAAFRCSSSRSLAGKRVLLVDDVRTTGATLWSCAEALQEGGARSVLTLVLASRDRDEKVQKAPQ